MKFRVDIPTRDKPTGARGWQCLVVTAEVTREARELALAEAGDLVAVRHRRDADLVLNDPARPLQVWDVTRR
ncbi:hypothetical protein OS965_29975 [Streptomyces sp. H27-G5]|uniref:hypothetical protein n=1 Tax=Streptomyces sp. H27-G5 TaxID=2996698 RepID=UPI00226F85D2|nr:hypothetical protein [Streptomyces sp. H27-G5]MCY0922339.1 hypothetical protein [Streptomyces sp. H27-G5]